MIIDKLIIVILIIALIWWYVIIMKFLVYDEWLRYNWIRGYIGVLYIWYDMSLIEFIMISEFLCLYDIT